MDHGLLKFALPILLSIALQSLSGSINAVWVGRYLGEVALTATSNANATISLFVGAALGIETAATILVGQCVGQGSVPEAKRIISTGAIFFAAVSVVMAVIGAIVSGHLLAWMNTPADSFPLAVSYMRVTFAALPWMYMFAFVMSVLRGTGDSKTPLYFMLLSIVIQTVLNPAFIFGAGPVPEMGVTGSALAAFVAQAVSLSALIVYLYHRKHPMCVHKDELWKLPVDWLIVGLLLRKGAPISAQVLVTSLAGTLMIGLVNRFGIHTTAAFGASLQLWTYVHIPAIAIAIAVSAMVAQNAGASNWDRIRSITRLGIAYSVLLTGSLVLAINILDTHAYSLFLPAGSEALQIACRINKIVSWSFVLFSICVVLFNVVRATGAVVVPLLIHTLSLFVVQLPFAALLIHRWQADAIWWSFPIYSILAVLLASLYYKYGGWRMVRIMKPAFV